MASKILLLLLALFAGILQWVQARERVFYIAAFDVEWNYAPGGNLINEDFQSSDPLLTRSHDPHAPRIGRRYKKSIYREFTDSTYTKMKPYPPWQGILGPLIHAEVEDTIVIHFFNNASGNFSMHPHGVFYNKNHEGAFYQDGTGPEDKMDDGLPPGTTYTYRWTARPDYGPTKGDPNCLSWAYHSHFMAENDINTGVMGLLLICKPGILDEYGRRTDVDREFALLFMVMNENQNLYLEENIENYLPGFNPEELVEDPNFELTNFKFTINGYTFGNLPNLTMCQGDKVSWHLLGLGAERDLHSVNFAGQTIIEYHHRKDVINLFPAISTTAIMKADNPGSWLVSCRVAEHFQNGMQALFHVLPCGGPRSKKFKMTGKIREYFIAAEEVIWDYAPSGLNQFTQKPLGKDNVTSAYFGSRTIGGVYKKVVYRGYTDSTFTERLPQPKYLGIMGPPIRAEVDDEIRVVFFNKANRPYSIQPFRAMFDKTQESTTYNDGHYRSAQFGVPPGGTKVFRWQVPKSVGPTDADPYCLTGRYHSGVDFVRDSYSGLVGPLLVCKKGTLDHYGIQKFVDKEFFIMFYVTDEAQSHYFNETLALFAERKPHLMMDLEDEEFQESNRMYSINGYVYGNLEGLTMCKDSVVSWHLIGVGGDADVHNAHFHGNTFTLRGGNRDSVWFIPETFETLIMVPDNPGKWALECRTNTHTRGGMFTVYKVKDCYGTKTEFHFSGKERIYYIAAVDQIWNFAPRDLDIITGEYLSETEKFMPFVNRNETRIGKRTIKTLYREYTDSTFSKRKKRGPEDLHLHMLGPIIKAEVGDVIRVYFKNMASRSYSIHPHGVFYRKTDEGSPYADGTSGDKKEDDAVPPGETYEYVWAVPERAGPGKDDFSCIPWAYYSDVNALKDLSTGLMGPLITCTRGTLTYEGKRHDVDREFVLVFNIVDENESWFLDDNIEKFTFNPALTRTLVNNDEGFISSNWKPAINGRFFGNVYGVDMVLGERVAFYLIGLGTEKDVHTVHFHGHTFLRKYSGSHRHDVIEVLPGTFHTVELLTVDPGQWLLHCHVNEHSEFGMMMLYRVFLPDGSLPPNGMHFYTSPKHPHHYSGKGDGYYRGKSHGYSRIRDKGKGYNNHYAGKGNIYNNYYGNKANGFSSFHETAVIHPSEKQPSIHEQAVYKEQNAVDSIPQGQSYVRVSAQSWINGL